MADLVVAALVPWPLTKVIDGLLKGVLEEAGNVVHCKEYCNDLRKTMEPLQPVLAKLLASAEAGNVSEDVYRWLGRLKECLMQAREQIQRCSVPPRNWFARRTLAQDILRLKCDLQSRLDEAPIVNLRLLMGMADQIREIAQTAPLGTQARAGSSCQRPLEKKLPKVLFGVDKASQLLEKALVEGEDMWVGIWGPGGCGKTLLAQTANNSQVVRPHFEEGPFWLTVSREPDIRHMQSKLHKIITNRDEHFESREDGKTRLFNVLKGKKALLILDDVWDRNVLEWFDVLTEGSGSKVLVTSRNKQVVARGFQEQVRLLNEENSIKLFCVHAFPDLFPRQHSLESPLQVLAEKYGKGFEDVVRDIVAECKHLPLALKVTGGALADREPPEFRLALEELRDLQGFTQGDAEEHLYKTLKLSYDDLEGVKGWGKVLQQCFLYFAAFPEDYEVDREDLVKYWIGDGLIRYSSDGSHMDVAEYLLRELSRRSLIEITKEYGDYCRCTMHDVLRDLALYIARLAEDVCLLQPGKGLETFPEEWTRQERSLKARRLSLMANKLKVVPKVSLNAPELRVLMLNGNGRLREMEDGFLINFPNLQMLDLSHTSLTHLPDDFGRLKNLVLLDLSRTRIRCLPDSFGSLANLVILDLSQASLRSLPDEFGRLVNLKVLDLSSNVCLQSLPSSIWEMVNLEHLDLSKCGSQLDPDLGQICKLIKLRYFGTLRSFEHCRPRWLGNLNKGLTLHLESRRQETLPLGMSKLLTLKRFTLSRFQELKSIPDELETLTSLEILCISACHSLSGLPSWVSTLQELDVLEIFACAQLKDLPALDKLQNLRTLKLSSCDSLEQLPHTSGCAEAFPMLETLEVTVCKKFSEFPKLEPGALPRLSRLYLEHCNLYELDNSLQVLSGLQSLSLSSCERLATLPDSVFARLQKLEKLRLRGAGVTELPESICRLPLLKMLELSGCKKLRVLPWPDMQSNELFPSLEEANFTGSSVRHIPVCMVSSRLKSMYLAECTKLTVGAELWRQLELNSVKTVRRDVIAAACIQQVHPLDEENIKLFCTSAFPDMFPRRHGPESTLQVLAEHYGTQEKMKDEPVLIIAWTMAKNQTGTPVYVMWRLDAKRGSVGVGYLACLLFLACFMAILLCS